MFDPQAHEEIEYVIGFVKAIRSVRSELNVPAKARLDTIVSDANETTIYRLDKHYDAICQMAGLHSIVLVRN